VDNREAIQIIKSNYPSENYTLLREALDLAIELLEDKDKKDDCMKEKNKQCESFQFYVDPIPDWFMDKVSSNEVILINCNYNRYSIDEAYCEIKTKDGIIIVRGGEYVIRNKYI
jgi:hypothetical protein